MINTKQKILVWIRRDLRLKDHTALYQASKDAANIKLVFVFDYHILDPLKQKSTEDHRLQFICESLAELQFRLAPYKSAVLIRYGDPKIEIPMVAQEQQVNAVYWNRDYSEYPRQRDAAVTNELMAAGIQVQTFQDHVMVEPDTLLNKEQKPYQVFTPYSNAWRQSIGIPTHKTLIANLEKCGDVGKQPSSTDELLKFCGFKKTESILKGGEKEGQKQLDIFRTYISNYDTARDYPYLNQTSYMSVYIRHGCISIRQLVALAQEQDSNGADVWLTELIWREFYQMIAYHYPHIRTGSFKPKYQRLEYPGSEEHLEAWKQGQTGFPIIDAAMRCLNQTGWMHNRLRMLTASFLCKLALVHWRRGERYFAWKLLDYEFASNNGGWQWASGTGCDAAPYFRIFNPETQSKTYDKEAKFIKQYCPELEHLSAKEIHNPLPHLRGHYPLPIIDYKRHRQLALELYRQVDQ
ncbi:MAG: deoxyribodipyrimidine photo-lyase [bacterium]